MGCFLFFVHLIQNQSPWVFFFFFFFFFSLFWVFLCFFFFFIFFLPSLLLSIFYIILYSTADMKEIPVSLAETPFLFPFSFLFFLFFSPSQPTFPPLPTWLALEFPISVFFFLKKKERRSKEFIPTYLIKPPPRSYLPPQDPTYPPKILPTPPKYQIYIYIYLGSLSNKDYHLLEITVTEPGVKNRGKGSEGGGGFGFKDFVC